MTREAGRPVRARIAAALAALALATPAHAQVSAATSAREPATFARARRQFDAGVRLLEDHRYAEAVAALERSLALRDSAPVRFNLALAQRGAGQYVLAIATFERFVAQAGDRHADLVAQAQALLAELRAALGHLTVRVAGAAPGTQLTVDGEPAPGWSPAAREVTLELDPSRHVIEARRPGYRPARAAVQLTAGGQSTAVLDAGAEPLPATLVVEPGDAAAYIVVDGRLIGRGRQSLELAAGEHRVEVRANGAPPQRRVALVAPGGRVILAFGPRPAGVLASWWFWTGVGVLVAGGSAAITAAALSREEPAFVGTWGVHQSATAAPR